MRSLGSGVGISNAGTTNPPVDATLALAFSGGDDSHKLP